MKKGFIMKKRFLFYTVCFLFSITSCQVGLGEAVDLTAPEVEIITPAPTDSVPKVFTVKGSASDNAGVKELVIEVEGTNQKYKLEPKTEQWSEVDSSGNWIPYSVGTYKGNKRKFEWSVSFSIKGASSGEDYILITKVSDDQGNEGKASKDERSITVDMQSPTVSIIEPDITSDIQQAVDKLSSYTTKNNAILTQLINGDFIINGSQREDTKLDYLIIVLDEKQDMQVPSIEECPDLKTTNPILYVKNDSSSLRNWEQKISMAQLPKEYQSGKHLIRLVTESHDAAGNIERKAQGWFIYFNDADTPWIEANFGSDDYDKESKVYPSCTLQGQAYDDDGLTSVNIQTFVEYEDQATGDKRNEKVDDQTFDAKGEKYYSWSIPAIGESHKFWVIIECEDIYGKKSEKVTRYMNVSDVNPPAIYITSPKSGDNILNCIDENGNFTVQGYLEDDGQIDSMKIVRISYGKESTQVNYLSDNYEGWTKVLDGNKLWTSAQDFTLSKDDVFIDPQTSVEKHKRNFEKTFNIFSDFGIEGNTQLMSNQNLVFLAQDVGGERSIETYSLQGDINNPSISIDKIEIYHKDGTSYSVNFDGQTQKLDPYIRESNGAISDKVVLSGKWSDDFTDKLNDKTKIGKIEFTWKGVSLTAKLNADGTWESQKITPPDSTTATISTQIKDWAGNIAKDSVSFYVNSNDPRLVRISASTPDGYYKEGDSIIITMEYNKKVTFSGGSSAPQLNLNNGGVAVYKTSSNTNGSNKHEFVYTIGENDSEGTINVSSIVLNSNKWIDADGTEITEMPTTAPSGANLNDNRTIIVDKTKPSVNSISAITAGGNYKAGKDVYIKLSFSEEVEIKAKDGKLLSDFSLGMNCGTDRKTSTTTKTNATDVLFTYHIVDGDFAAPLQISSINITDVEIFDRAGNSLKTPVISGSCQLSSSNENAINIKTSKPKTPVIQGITSGDKIYSSAGVSFTVDKFESTSKIKKYSIDGGKSWNDYPESGTVNITDNGSYTVTAYQEDASGNKSEEAAQISFTIDKGDFLTSINAQKSDGTYTTGTLIPIVLKFRYPVSATNAKIRLNTTPAKEITLTSVTKQSELTFNYTVEDGQNCENLNVTQFTCSTITDEKGRDISSLIPLPKDNNLGDNRTITIITGTPKLISTNPVVLNESGENPVLEIIFDKAILKDSGNITIKQIISKQENGGTVSIYKAPAVLSKAKYTEYNKKTDISSYYEEGTNGATDNFESDLSEKYVLKYTYDTSDTTLCNLFTAQDKLDVITITVPVASSAVSVDNDTLKINLSGSYALPVKGAEYTVTIPANLVQDNLGNKNTADTVTRTITLSGVENPVIRVNKSNETISDGKATQPLTADVKIDCQTPGTTIYYRTASAVSNVDTVNYANLIAHLTAGTTHQINYPDGSSLGVETMPQDSSTDENTHEYTSAFTIGDSSNTTNGMKISIAAQAKQGNNWSLPAYEVAYRSIVTIQNFDHEKKVDSAWIRGGDSESGGVSTPGFPISWDTTEYSKVRLMTQTDDETETWYWCTWALNNAAYIGFLGGDVPNDAATNGPKNWTWGCDGFTRGKSQYPLYPGDSLLYSNDNGWDKHGNGYGTLYWVKFRFDDKLKGNR